MDGRDGSGSKEEGRSSTGKKVATRKRIAKPASERKRGDGIEKLERILKENEMADQQQLNTQNTDHSSDLDLSLGLGQPHPVPAAGTNHGYPWRGVANFPLQPSRPPYQWPVNVGTSQMPYYMPHIPHFGERAANLATPILRPQPPNPNANIGTSQMRPYYAPPQFGMMPYGQGYGGASSYGQFQPITIRPPGTNEAAAFQPNPNEVALPLQEAPRRQEGEFVGLERKEEEVNQPAVESTSKNSNDPELDLELKL